MPEKQAAATEPTPPPPAKPSDLPGFLKGLEAFALQLEAEAAAAGEGALQNFLADWLSHVTVFKTKMEHLAAHDPRIAKDKRKTDPASHGSRYTPKDEL